MDKNKKPGIYFEDIVLLESHVGDLQPENKLAFNLVLTSLNRQRKDVEDKLVVIATFDAFYEVEDPVLNFQCKFGAFYRHEEAANMDWEDFSNEHAVAHMIPYVREFISNITWRMPLPRLNLPPINAYRLIEEYKNWLREGTEES